MINLLHVLGSNKRGGAELFAYRLLTALNSQPLNQAMAARQGGPYVDSLPNNTPCFPVPFKGFFDLRSKRVLKKIIKQFNPNIVLSYMNRASSVVSQLHTSKNYVHIARLGGYYDLKYYQHCDHFIVNTKDLADYLLKKGVNHQRIHTIYNFVNQKKGEAVTRSYTNKLIVAVGRLHQNKAFDTLIRALSHCDNTTLWIIGEGPERQALTQLIKKLKLTEKVSLLGWVNTPQDFVASADLCVCPSRHEPLGNVILEAWAQQKPILCTRNQGAVDLIKQGETGWLVDIDNPIEMANAIQTLLQDNTLCNEMANKGYQHYHKNFSQEIIAQQYFDLFKQLATK